MKAPAVLAQANLANALTSVSVAASVCAVMLTTRGSVVPALFIGAIALPCDVFDGSIARRRNTTSPFGAQMDSLSDAIGFGLLPAALGYSLGVNGVSSIALIAYTLAAVWRLAYFHQIGLSVDPRGRECFTGMPTTLAAAIFYVAASLSFWLPVEAGRLLLVSFFVGGAFLMNSSFSFPKHSIYSRVLWILVPIALASLLLRG